MTCCSRSAYSTLTPVRRSAVAARRTSRVHARPFGRRPTPRARASSPAAGRDPAATRPAPRRPCRSRAPAGRRRRATEQVVVASAAADGAQLALGVEQLEDDAGVVRQPANDLEVDGHPVDRRRGRRGSRSSGASSAEHARATPGASPNSRSIWSRVDSPSSPNSDVDRLPAVMPSAAELFDARRRCGWRSNLSITREHGRRSARRRRRARRASRGAAGGPRRARERRATTVRSPA